MNGIEQIFLQPDDGMYGFCRTQEGRLFLRELLEPFLNRFNFREGKVATIIADQSGSIDVQTREVDRTKSALRRWYKDGQAELWPKDSAKNLRYMERIEKEMMAVEAVAEILSDQAVSISKIQTGESIGRFFFGTIGLGKLPADIDYLQSEIEGLYEIYDAPRFSDPSQKETINIDGEIFVKMQSGQVRPGPAHNYWEENGDWYVISDQLNNGQGERNYGNHGDRYMYVRRISSYSFMLIHSFVLAQGGRVNPGDVKLDDVRSGYGYILEDGSFHSLLAAHSPPSPRTYSVFTPVAVNAFPVNWTRPKSEMSKMWSHSSRPFNPKSGVYPTYANAESGILPFDHATLWCKPKYADVDKIKLYLEKMLWNVLI